MDFPSKIREDFNDQQAKATLPNINYKAVARSQRIMEGHGKSGKTPDALGELSSKGRFREKSFIPVLDELEINLRRAISCSGVAEMFLFFAI